MSTIATPSLVSRLQNDATFLHSFVSSPTQTLTAAGATDSNSMLLASTPRQLHGASLEATGHGQLMSSVLGPVHIAPTATAVPHTPMSSVMPHGGPVSSVMPHGPVSSVMPHGTFVSSVAPAR